MKTLLAALLLLSVAAAQPSPAPQPSAGPAAEKPGGQQQLPVVVMVATGGTIAMKIDPVKNAPVPAISGEDLVATVPELGKLARVEVQNLSNVPSSYMDVERWVAVSRAISEALARPEVSGAIVSHGTDTLEETAWFLDLTVRSDKPIVLIGAQRNASEKDFDGPRNILNAVRICVSPDARGKGAMIALNNQINAAREVFKGHTSSVETFQSGEMGFLGIADADRVIFWRAPLRRQHVPLAPQKDPKGSQKLPRVEIIPTYGGVDATLLRAALAAGVDGLVVQALGWGNVNVPMYEAIQEAVKKGVPVVISTRVPQGRVLPHYGFKGGGKTLQEAGAVFADDLSPQKARILLMLALQTTKEQKALQKMFDR